MRKLTTKQKIGKAISLSFLILAYILFILNLGITITVNNPDYLGYIYGIEVSIEQANCFTKFLDLTSAIFLGLAFISTILNMN